MTITASTLHTKVRKVSPVSRVGPTSTVDVHSAAATRRRHAGHVADPLPLSWDGHGMGPKVIAHLHAGACRLSQVPGLSSEWAAGREPCWYGRQPNPIRVGRTAA